MQHEANEASSEADEQLKESWMVNDMKEHLCKAGGTLKGMKSTLSERYGDMIRSADILSLRIENVQFSIYVVPSDMTALSALFYKPRPYIREELQLPGVILDAVESKELRFQRCAFRSRHSRARSSAVTCSRAAFKCTRSTDLYLTVLCSLADSLGQGAQVVRKPMGLGFVLASSCSTCRGAWTAICSGGVVLEAEGRLEIRLIEMEH